MKSFAGCVILFSSLLFFFGCASGNGDFVAKSESELKDMEEINSSAHNDFLSGKYESAEHKLKQIALERTVSRPLYQMELISVLLLSGKHEEAHKIMMSLHEDLETLIDIKSEKKAQSIWHGEVNKVYKGDAYEKSTFYALLALSFIRNGNYEDALRSVKNGLLAEADANSEKAVEDYALLHYLGYIAASKMNNSDDAQEYLRAMNQAVASRGMKLDEQNNLVGENCFKQLQKENPNVLLVVWGGDAPAVDRVGEYEEKRVIIPGKNCFDSLMLSLEAQMPFMAPNLLGDVNYQATTRGGRLMDNVLANKAAVKKGMEVTRNVLFICGTALMFAGAQTMSNPVLGVSLLGAGGGCFLLGSGFWVVGYYMNPAADARYWRNLPGQFYLIPLRMSPGKYKIMLNGYKKSDIAGTGIYDIEVREKQTLNVIHLPLMKNADFNEIMNAKFHNEYEKIIEKIENDRVSKEIK